MSVKKIGIFLGYSCVVDLRREGLGRQLAGFIKGGIKNKDVQLVLAYPEWLQGTVEDLFESERINISDVEILSTGKVPFILRCYYFLKKLQQPRVKKRKFKVKLFLNKYEKICLKKFISAKNAPIMVYYGALCFLYWNVGVFFKLSERIFSSVIKRIFSFFKIDILKNLISSEVNIKKHEKLSQLYALLEDQEISNLVKKINLKKDVDAWYSPTAFWPAFNKIKAPKLVCLPDLVLENFPVKFSTLNLRFSTTFNRVNSVLRNGDYYVTYSDYVKWNTLVKNRGYDPDKIFTIRHGANFLNDFIKLERGGGRQFNDDLIVNDLFKSALQKSRSSYCRNFKNLDVDFLFYASQIRPNKNVNSLLEAYNILLRKRHRSVKLILTGRIDLYSEVQDKLNSLQLDRDVISLPDLTIQQLAACYSKALLAVNPTLFEGGFPFTFVEALSVGTPVVMSRIPVVEELLAGRSGEDKFLFDPYDPEDIADKIEWALDHNHELFALQKPIFDKLSSRTWEDVANDHFEVLKKICADQEK